MSRDPRFRRGLRPVNGNAPSPRAVCDACKEPLATGDQVLSVRLPSGGDAPVHELCFLRVHAAEQTRRAQVFGSLLASLTWKLGGDIRLTKEEIHAGEQGGELQTKDEGATVRVMVGDGRRILVVPNMKGLPAPPRLK